MGADNVIKTNYEAAEILLKRDYPKIARSVRQRCISPTVLYVLLARVKKILEQLSRTQFLTEFEFSRSFLRFNVAGKKLSEIQIT